MRSFPALAAAGLLFLAPSAAAQTVGFDAHLDGGQEVPPNLSVAYGTAYFVLDREANTLGYSITVARLNGTETAAHLHGFAPPGTTAPVLLTLPLGKTKSGSWTYPEALEDQLVAGLAYVDVHTTNFPAGQVRGQLARSPADATFGAHLDRFQVVGMSGSKAQGTGTFTIDTVKNRLKIEITVQGFKTTEIGAHIHAGKPGQTGNILYALPLGMHKVASWKYDEADEPMILAGNTYVNIHTLQIQSGEIRGQIVPLAGNPSTYCAGKVNSQGCTPAIGWTGRPRTVGSDDFTITCDQLVNQESGLFFWGVPTNVKPFFGGTLCVLGPLQRTSVLGTGGNAGPPDCSGTLSFFFSHAYETSKGLGPGMQLYGQWWATDAAHPDGTGVGLSDAVQFELRP